MKPIHFSRHAWGYTATRGFTVAEVEAAIRTCPWGKAELGRLDCRKGFPFGQDWNGRFTQPNRFAPCLQMNLEK